ncbi:MAG: hypothetical protein WCB68_04725 [Pyrinomonadaceae bacterium]
MRSRIALLLFTLALFSTIALAQDGKRTPFVVQLQTAGFVSFKIETIAADTRRPDASRAVQEMVQYQVFVDDDHVIHRILVDKVGTFLFGYDLVVEPVATSKQFRVFVRPLSAEFQQRLRTRNSFMQRPLKLNASISTLPRSTEAQIIEDGDAFALDLLVNPQTGDKIVDTVKVSYDRSNLTDEHDPATDVTTPPQDFTLANVELSVKDYKLMINDELAGGGKPASGCQGALVWFYVPGRGRYIFSLIPRAGYEFRKTAMINDNKITFDDGKDHIAWISSAPVIGSGGTWNLWVLYDPTYVPLSDSYSTTHISGGTTTIPDANMQLMKSYGSISDTLKSRTALEATQASQQIGSQKVESKLPPRNQHISIGSADRIENLLPKN